MDILTCINCSLPYPDRGAPYRCLQCGGLFDYIEAIKYKSDHREAPLEQSKPPGSDGIWRYRHSFGLPGVAPSITLGEGDTPLVWAEAFGHKVAFKCEYLNPTGSFKDRGTALVVSFLASRGVESAVEDSSGNAGASFAAYAARAGIRARVFVPDYASGPKCAQIEAYGAEVVRVPGPRSNAAEAVRKAADEGSVYASHAHLPHLLPGYATIAYELMDQTGRTPGTIIAPVGQGGLLLGIARGFNAMLQAGKIAQIPKLVGVQARACAPLWAMFAHGPAGLESVTEGDTIAEGVRVRYPLRGDELLQMMGKVHGIFLAIDEKDILDGRDHLSQMGFYVEPTSAIVWGALAQIAGKVPEPIVLVLTGSGLKASL